jgi:hypothetical protein
MEGGGEREGGRRREGGAHPCLPHLLHDMTHGRHICTGTGPALSESASAPAAGPGTKRLAPAARRSHQSSASMRVAPVGVKLCVGQFAGHLRAAALAVVRTISNRTMLANPRLGSARRNGSGRSGSGDIRRPAPSAVHVSGAVYELSA